MESCLSFNIDRLVKEVELDLVHDILTLSLQERLNLPESRFCFDGNDIYAYPDPVIENMKIELRMDAQPQKSVLGENIIEFPAGFLGPIDPKKGN